MDDYIKYLFMLLFQKHLMFQGKHYRALIWFLENLLKNSPRDIEHLNPMAVFPLFLNMSDVEDPLKNCLRFQKDGNLDTSKTLDILYQRKITSVRFLFGGHQELYQNITTMVEFLEDMHKKGIVLGKDYIRFKAHFLSELEKINENGFEVYDILYFFKKYSEKYKPSVKPENIWEFLKNKKYLILGLGLSFITFTGLAYILHIRKKNSNINKNSTKSFVQKKEQTKDF